MIKLSSALLFSLAISSLATAQADVLYDNSNITTGIGNGANGADTSIVASGALTLGFGVNSVVGTVSLADDFTLSSDSLITGFVLNAYSTSTYPYPPVSPFTGTTVQIWSAQPGTGGATVLATSTTISSTSWTGVYRAASVSPTNAQRPVFDFTVDFSSVPLTAGTYWTSFTITGIGSPGNSNSIFTPPVMNTDGTMPTGNAVQTLNGSTWSPIADTGSSATADVPLTVLGTASPVPEPTNVALVAVLSVMGIVIGIRRRLA